LNDWLTELPDRRDPLLITYPVPNLLWQALLLFVLRLGSRRELRQERWEGSFHANLDALAATQTPQVAHPDTVNNYLEGLAPEHLQALGQRVVRHLLANKVLNFARVADHFLVAIDGTGFYSTSVRHCPHCLTQRQPSGNLLYYHNVLEAKLVTVNGLAFSLASEFIQNTDPQATKQDCERKAFYRLLPELRRAFPRLPMCLLLDGAFACKEVLDQLKENRCEGIISFKEGSLPRLWAEAQRQVQRRPANRLCHRPDPQTRQDLSWVTDLEHEGRPIHAIFCPETVTQPDQTTTTTHYSWLTTLRPTARQVVRLANEGGRQRWKIENQGFNDQKNGGFELEHGYGTKGHAWQNWYYLLQLAHLLSQLLIKGDLFAKLLRHTAATPAAQRRCRTWTWHRFYGSVKHFITSLRRAWVTACFSPLTQSDFARHIQIRLNTA